MKSTRRPLSLEMLEDRTLPAITPFELAALLSFANERASAASVLASPNDIDLFQVTLNQGDIVTVDVDAQSAGSPLNSHLRVFDENGNPIAANDDFDGRDSRLTFQATASGTYFIGVSASGNSVYNLETGANVVAGQSNGLFDLLVTRTTAGATLQPDLVGASFEVVQDTAIWGESVRVNYRIENRGGAAAGPFTVDLRLSADNTIDGADTFLTSTNPTGLAAGASVVGFFDVTLPGSATTAPGGFSLSQGVFLGLRVDSGTSVTELNEGNNSSQRRGSDWDNLRVLTLRAETGSNDTTAEAIANGTILNSQVAGAISGGERDIYLVSLSQPGRLKAQVTATGVDTRLTLLGPMGDVLVSSESAAPGDASDRIVQHLFGQSGNVNYFLVVEGVTSGSGTYSLKVEFDTAVDPNRDLPTISQPSGLLQADFNRDGILDLAVSNNGGSSNVSINYGLGDGLFRPLVTSSFGQGSGSSVLAAADFNGDGLLDLAKTNKSSDTVSIALQQTNGTFQNMTSGGSPVHFAVGDEPSALLAVDLNADGRVDLATANNNSRDVTILKRQADGSFQRVNLALGLAGTSPLQFPSLVARDFNGDGRLDLAVGYSDQLYVDPTRIKVFLQAADGSFAIHQSLTFVSNGITTFANSPNWSTTAGDFDNDGDIDLAAGLANFVHFYRNDGLGNFTELPDLVQVGTRPVLTTGDVNGDAFLDLVVTDSDPEGKQAISVFGGLGTGRFERLAEVAVGGRSPLAVVLGDHNSDGLTDLAAINSSSDTLSVLFGLGVGHFQESLKGFKTGVNPVALVTGDFTSDGKPDLVVGNFNSLSAAGSTLLVGEGDGTFESGILLQFPGTSGSVPTHAVGDINGDGRLDLLNNQGSGGNPLAVRFGNGDGTFSANTPILGMPGGELPRQIIVADIDGDGRNDVVVGGTFQVTVFRQQPDRTLQRETSFTTGGLALPLKVANVNGDTGLDVVLADTSNDRVLIFLRQANGTYQELQQGGVPVRPGVGDNPLTLGVGDFDGVNGNDIVTINNFSRDVSVLLRQADGTYLEVMPRISVGIFLNNLIVGDFDRDDKLDFAVSQETQGIKVYFGLGNGTFTAPTQINTPNMSASTTPISLQTDDYNGDGLPDLAAAVARDSTVAVFLGLGNRQFVNSRLLASNGIRSTPMVANINGGPTDMLIVNDSGSILFRSGTATPGTFEAPQTVNPTRTARDLAVVSTQQGPVIAALDEVGSGISLYRLQAGSGTFLRTAGPTAGFLPVRIVAGRLDADLLDDLFVANAGSNTISVYRQNVDGTFTLAQELAAGTSPSDLRLIPNSSDGRVNQVLVTGALSGDLTVFANNGGTLVSTGTFRAGNGPYSTTIDALDGTRTEFSLATSSYLATGNLNADGNVDAVVVNLGSESVASLFGRATGGFVDPQSTRLGFVPTAAVVDDFDGNTVQDLALLDSVGERIVFFTTNSQGAFVPLLVNGTPLVVNAGNSPGSFTVVDINADNRRDILVGNGFGDVLIILGNGDGTFRPFVRADQRVPFVLTDLDGDETLDVILADQSQDMALAQNRIEGTGTFTPGDFQRDGTSGLIGPGDVVLVDVNKDGLKDLIFANSGSNNVLVYLNQGTAGFATMPLKFVTGTNPTDLWTTQLNDDDHNGVVDDRDTLDLVVANQGSNDVSVLFGSLIGANWSFTLGPRLAAGGLGPNAIRTDDVDGDGIPDILVTNGQSGTLTTIPGVGTAGVGTGFFNDGNSLTNPIAGEPVMQTQFVDANLAFALTRSGDIFRFNPSTGTSFLAFDAPREINAFSVMGNTIFTANRNGSVSFLESADGLSFAEIRTFTDPNLINPSALEVLQTGTDLFDVYLTNSGDSTPIVLTINVRQDQMPIKPDSPGLATVVTLLTDIVGDSITTSGTTSIQTISTFLVASSQLLTRDALEQLNVSELSDEDTLNGVGEELLTSLQAALGGSDEGNEPEPEQTPDLQQFITGMSDALERLRLRITEGSGTDEEQWLDWGNWMRNLLGTPPRGFPSPTIPQNPSLPGSSHLPLPSLETPAVVDEVPIQETEMTEEMGEPADDVWLTWDERQARWATLVGATAAVTGLLACRPVQCTRKRGFLANAR